jgi:hypothetical protein
MSPYFTDRSAGTVHFIGTASNDTVLAGNGSVKFKWEGTPRALFGQVVRVERLGATAYERPMASASDRPMDIVVVPWAYGPDCRTLPWDASARWVRVGTRGLFSGQLREKADWIDGRPTIDVHMTLTVPYLGVAPRYRTVTRNPVTMVPDPALTPDELLDLYDVLPARFRGNEDSATVRRSNDQLKQWARDHADLGTRYPAKEIMFVARAAVGIALLRSTRSPVAGTYRFVIHLATGDSATIFARTEISPASRLWGLTTGTEHKYSADGFPEAAGYYVLVRTALTARELTATKDFTPSGLRAEGYLAFVEQPVTTSSDSTVWRGSADILGAMSRTVGDSVIAARLRTAEGETRAHAVTFADGRFIAYPDGRLRYEVRLPTTGALLYSMQGERLSTVTFTPR